MKQIILVRHDLNMRKGKIVAQACHGSNAILLNEFTKYPFRWSIYFIVKKYYKWIGKDSISKWLSGSFKKICLQTKTDNEYYDELDSLQILFEVVYKCKNSNVLYSIVKDSGLTEFDGKETVTCVVIGPDEDEKIDKITGCFKLL